MLKRKRIREKGKINFSRYFQTLKEGDKVCIVKDVSSKSVFPKSIQGRTGIIEVKRGKSYIVKIDIGKAKRFIIHPVHLKKVKT